jgi:hypothetical protein
MGRHAKHHPSAGEFIDANRWRVSHPMRGQGWRNVMHGLPPIPGPSVSGCSEIRRRHDRHWRKDRGHVLSLRKAQVERGLICGDGDPEPLARSALGGQERGPMSALPPKADVQATHQPALQADQDKSAIA